MRLRDLLEQLGMASDTRRHQASRERLEDELFPSLLVTRLEERRLLNAAPVVVAPAPTPKESGTESHGAPGHDVAGSDIETLAVTMYGGPTHGDFTPEMQQLTHGGSNGGSHGIDKPDAHDDKNGAASLGPITTTATSATTSNGNPAVASSQVVADITLGTNQPPVNVVPVPQSTNEDTPLSITGLSVSDPAAGTNPITTQFTVTHGTLSVDTTGGVPQPSGAILLPNGVVITGNGTNTLTILGTPTQISSELSLGLNYRPTEHYNGSDLLTMTSNDLGATGLPLVDVDTVAITVAPINEGPVNTVPGARIDRRRYGARHVGLLGRGCRLGHESHHDAVHRYARHALGRYHRRRPAA